MGKAVFEGSPWGLDPAGNVLITTQYVNIYILFIQVIIFTKKENLY